MNQIEVEISGKKVILSERPAKDALDLADYAKHNNDGGSTLFLFVYCRAIADSIKATRRHFKWYKFVKRLLYRKFNIKYLFKRLSQSEILRLHDAVLGLEDLDVKKKESQTETDPAKE